MVKFTKIVATIGPSTESEEMIEKLITSGVDVFRFNFKHNTVEWHDKLIQRVNKIANKLQKPIGTLIDLQGPEIRILLKTDHIILKENKSIPFGGTDFSITHPQIIPYLKNGQKVIADDGLFIFKIEKQNGNVYLRCIRGGVLKNRKSLNIPGAQFPFPVLVDRDFEGLHLAQRHEIDFVALSFVRTVEDLKTVKKEMKKYKVNGKIIAKIETQTALDNLDSIIVESDGVMVARGDMGVELPIEEVPYHQKLIIKQCIRKGIPVITATQMLQSMTQSPIPTRAEVSDIANATYDLTDAVMLSEETALGKYPQEVIKVMSDTVSYNEKKNVVDSRLRFNFEVNDNASLLCDTAYSLYMKMRQSKEEVGGFLVFTKSGRTARLISRYRPLVPIFAFSPDKKIVDSLTLNYGVVPLYQNSGFYENAEHKQITDYVDYLLQMGYLKKGQKAVVLYGEVWGKQGETSTIKLITV